VYASKLFGNYYNLFEVMYVFISTTTYSGRAHCDGGQEVVKYIARGKAFLFEGKIRA
jgi:hypothetical protein